MAAGRPVRAATRLSPESLLGDSEGWLTREAGYPALGELLETAMRDPRLRNLVLGEFGRYLWKLGLPYVRYANTVNAVVSRAPGIRRAVGQAWDLGYRWMALGPTNHHATLPGVVLQALVWLWQLRGWPRMAVLLFSCFSGIMMPGEFLKA